MTGPLAVTVGATVRGPSGVSSTTWKGAPVGDKSPKAKDKAKKQDTAEKNQKQANANEKAAKQAANNPKKK